MNTRADKTAADVSQEVLRQLEAMSELTARLKDDPDAASVSASARALAESAEDVRRLVEQARDLQRAQMGKLAFEKRPTRLRDVMAALEDTWRERAASRGIAFTVVCEGGDQVAEIDPIRFCQLFDALVGRAFAETTTGSIFVSLSTQAGPGGMTLEGYVRDSGRPLSAGQLAHIFEADDEAEHASLSTRVGMALANRLVQAFAGVLQAQTNDAGGVAVTFSLMAPAVTVETRQPHVLIVDDNVTNRIVAEALCEMFDCTSEQVQDGVEALEAVKTRAYDLILMDIKMPRMDGIAATREIRKMTTPTGLIPIVALTAATERGDLARYRDAGINDTIEKPIKPERLAQVLSQVPVWIESARIAAA